MKSGSYEGGQVSLGVIFVLTVAGPHYFRLVFFHRGINDDSAAQTQRLAFSAKGHFEFVEDGCFKGNTMLGAVTICKGGIRKTLSLNKINPEQFREQGV